MLVIDTCSCRPVAEPYWYGLLLIGCSFLVLSIVFIFMFPFNVKYIHTEKKKSTYPRYTDYIALITIVAFFYIAWGFGLPATRPIYLGVARVIFEIIFIVFSSLLGFAMVLFYIILSDKVRNACCRNRLDPSSRQMYAYSVGDDNVYMTTTGGEKQRDDEIPFSDLDAMSPPPDYDNISGVVSPFYSDDASVAEEPGLDYKEDAFTSDSKEDLGNVFTNMDGVDTLF